MMKTTIQKGNIARIEVQRDFCQNCGLKICQELQKIEDITNVFFYPENAMVVFTFFRANELAKALNVLTELGYPEIGEDVSIGYFDSLTRCNCQSVDYAA